jgi:voltage-gated potassium channel
MEILVVNTIRAIRTLWRDPHFRSLARLAVIAITSGTVFYWLVEDLRPIDSLYFSVITLASVGYGDFAPKTDAGKLFTVVYVLVGVGILLSFLTRVAAQVVSTHVADQRNGHDLRHRLHRDRPTRKRP